ncbi:MAG: TIGR03617 family F420-dependent LLM class oxidoreductase [Chloroflexales bacterium]|nr:TIGR03617 family F420-dependent LLM class oxidoreductase [Chloroflexales bacterium]
MLAITRFHPFGRYNVRLRQSIRCKEAPVKLDLALGGEALTLAALPATARAADALGFGALWVPETQHNAFLPLALAAEHSQRMGLGTSVAIAFARSPMVVAQAAWDLQALSAGRFVLGLGTQVQAHIERRFSMPWDQPVARLRDYIGALRAIWASWQGDGKLDYRGPFYQHTLMTPFFNPGPIAHPRIPIAIAGVNQGLAKLAGEAADGFHVHPLNSAAYLRHQLRPAIAEGAARTGRSPSDVELLASVFVITGANDAAIDQARAAARAQIAFYASTPSYRPVLASHGWERVGEQLSRLAATKRWAELPALIDDEMLHTFAVEAPPHLLGQAVRERYEGLLDRVAFYMPFAPGQHGDLWRSAIEAFGKL